MYLNALKLYRPVINSRAMYQYIQSWQSFRLEYIISYLFVTNEWLVDVPCSCHMTVNGGRMF